jgi:DNA primase catalytic core
MINYQLQRRIVNETNITEVVSEYVTLTKKGNSMFGLCPFHNDNNPSMSVSDKVKMYNCFSCGAKGYVINFVSRIENITLEQAAIKLAKRIGIQVDERKNAQALKETENDDPLDTNPFANTQETMINVAKNRNGKTGVIKFDFLMNIGKFVEKDNRAEEE